MEISKVTWDWLENEHWCMSNPVSNKDIVFRVRVFNKERVIIDDYFAKKYEYLENQQVELWINEIFGEKASGCVSAYPYTATVDEITEKMTLDELRPKMGIMFLLVDVEYDLLVKDKEEASKKIYSLIGLLREKGIFPRNISFKCKKGINRYLCDIDNWEKIQSEQEILEILNTDMRTSKSWD